MMQSFIFSALLSGLPLLTVAQVTDTVMYARDSAIEMETDPTTQFFQGGEKISKTGKTWVIGKNGKAVSLQKLLASEDFLHGDQVLYDLDGDGKKELLIYNYTGGAHCCDAISVYRLLGPGRYQWAGRLFAGNTAIGGNGLFTFDLHESFGYFFTCYACGLADSSGAAPIDPSGISVKYAKGRLQVVPGDKELKNYLIDNLARLSEMQHPVLRERHDMDEGFRKAYALNLAVYYYSFGKNMPVVEQLFRRYYLLPDAALVWREFTRSLREVRNANSF